MTELLWFQTLQRLGLNLLDLFHILLEAQIIT